jgi:hypothetical protein
MLKDMLKPSSLERYKRCFRGGTPASSFLPAAPDDAPDGCTMQVVIAPDALRCIDLED